MTVPLADEAGETNYVALRVGSARTLVSSRARTWVREALATHATLYDWARTSVCAQPLGGRAKALAVPDPLQPRQRRPALVVRHYARGGLLAPILGDRYPRFAVTRPEREIVASAEARRRGIRTPEIIAGAWYRSGPFYRADLVTELVAGARTLSDVLSDGDPAPRRAALFAAGRLAQRLGAAGIRHADLHAGNVLLADGPPFEAFAIDMDRARVTRGPSERGAVAMLRRLEGSVRALADPPGTALSRRDTSALRAGFQSAP